MTLLSLFLSLSLFLYCEILRFDLFAIIIIFFTSLSGETERGRGALMDVTYFLVHL